MKTVLSMRVFLAHNSDFIWRNISTDDDDDNKTMEKYSFSFDETPLGAFSIVLLVNKLTKEGEITYPLRRTLSLHSDGSL